jgi:NAD-dependent SIR2 family protein deacetylase
MFSIRIGNRCVREEKEAVEWTMEISAPPFAPIDEVVVHLHPTFTPSTVTLSNKENPKNSLLFSLTRVGWGTFPVRAELLRRGAVVDTVVHDLSFEEGGSFRTVQVGKWPAPRLVVECAALARPGYDSAAAHEFLDPPEVLEDKIAVLAGMIVSSPSVVVYSGAGISTSSGINDYATQAAGSVVKPKAKAKSGFDCEPTLAHRVLASLSRQNPPLLHRWVQQNHDGLPQKAGLDPALLNEIHGSWFDPSNPVVPMTGTLREDLIDDVVRLEGEADLVMAIGTSLCGMNADRIVSGCAKRAKRGRATGTVILSVQETAHDKDSALRIFATIDSAMDLLAKTLGIEPTAPRARPSARGTDRFTVTVAGKTKVWDLSDGARVRVNGGPGDGFKGVVLGKTADGHYRIELPYIREGDPKHGKGRSVMILGSWWVESAQKGKCKQLPVENY